MHSEMMFISNSDITVSVPEYLRSIPFFDSLLNVSPPGDNVINVDFTNTELRDIALILSLQEVEYTEEQMNLLDYLGFPNNYKYPVDMWSILIREQIKLWISTRIDTGYSYLTPLKFRQSSVRYKVRSYLGKFMENRRIVIGGNRLASTMYGMSRQLYHSIEVFFICSRDEAIEVIRQVRRDPRTEWIKYTSTHIIVRTKESRVSLSFRRALYSNICHVAHSIDTDPFCVVSDGGRLYGTERYLHSVKTRTSYYHPERCNLQHHNDLLFSHCMLYELVLPEYSGYLKFKGECQQFIKDRITKVSEVDDPIMTPRSLSGIFSSGDGWYYVTPAYCSYMDLSDRHEFMGFFGSCNNVLKVLEGRMSHVLKRKPRELSKELAHVLDCLFLTIDAVNGQWGSMGPEDIVESSDTQFISKLLCLYYEIVCPRDYDQVSICPYDQLFCARYLGYCPRIADHKAMMDLPENLNSICMNRFSDISQNEVRVYSRDCVFKDISSDLIDVHYIPHLVDSGMYYYASTGRDDNIDIGTSLMRLPQSTKMLMIPLSYEQVIKRVLPNHSSHEGIINC